MSFYDKLKGIFGQPGHAGATAPGDNELKQLSRATRVVVLDGANLGDVTEEVLVWVPQAAVRILAAYLVPSKSVTGTAEMPTLKLVKGDLAAGGYTNIDATGIAFTASKTAQTKYSWTVAGVAAAAIAAGTGVYIDIDTNGATTTDLGDTKLTVVFEWEYQN